MSVPYDYDQTNIEHLRAVVAEQEATIEYLREWFKEFESENAKLRELLLDCWDFSHLMHQVMAARFYELGLIDDGEARELGVEVWS